jgi:hypothetical protein
LCQHGFINLCPVEEPQDSVGATLSNSHGHFLLELEIQCPFTLLGARLMGVILISWPVPLVLLSVRWEALRCSFHLLPSPCSAKSAWIRSTITVLSNVW